VRRGRTGRAVVIIGSAIALTLVTLVVPLVSGSSPVHAAPPSGGLFPGGGVLAEGDAVNYGNFNGITLSSPAVAMATTATSHGYWVAAADGGVFSFGDAHFYGSTGSLHIFAPVVGMAATPDGGGYWLTALDGGVFAFGDAPFFGSTGAMKLNQPVVGMAATPDGRGYWLVAADGGIFAFGDAAFYGSTGAIQLNLPIVGMASTPDGRGYWLVAADGGIFSFGDAQFFGSAANDNIGTSVTGIAPTRDGRGYWLVAATAGVLSYGDAKFMGPSPNLPPFSPTAAIIATRDGGGYWILQPDDIATGFTNPPPGGGAGIVQTAASQVGPDPNANQGDFCNPYGPCEEWCSLFATWVWNQNGIGIPRYAFTGDVFSWGAGQGLDLGPTAIPAAGDFVMYGTGPGSASSSPHMAVVAQVWPDGAIATVDGDAGPEPNGKYAVITNGPFLPADSNQYNGDPIYGYVRP
jgi:hypothetical protein